MPALTEWINPVIFIEMSSTGDEKRLKELLTIGIKALKNNQFEQAIEHLSKAIQLKPDFAEAYFIRGIAYDKKDELEQAIQDYSKAIQLKPDFAEAYFNRGNAYYEKDELEQAIQDYSKAIELAPDDVIPLLNRAILYHSLRSNELALQDLENADRIKKTGTTLLLRAKICLSEGRTDKAVKLLREAKSLKPVNTVINLWLIYARFLDINRKTQTAIWDNSADKEHCRLKSSDHPYYQLELNSLIAELNELLEIGNSHTGTKADFNSTIHYWLGIFHYLLNDFFTGAVENLNRALQNAGKKQARATPARSLLNHIWNYSCHPSWWRWWFFSPPPLLRWGKRILGSLLVLILAFINLLPVLRVFINKIPALEPAYHIILTLILLLMLFSPVISRFRAREFEVEFTPPPPETGLVPASMEMMLKKSEIHRSKSP